MRTVLLFTGLVPLLCATSACDQDPIVSIDGSVQAYTKGVVLSADEEPVANATVDRRVFDNPACDGEPVAVGVPALTTTDEGVFRGQIGLSLHPPFDGCIEFDVTPPPGSGLGPGVFGGYPLSFREAFPWADSLDVVLVLQIP